MCQADFAVWGTSLLSEDKSTWLFSSCKRDFTHPIEGLRLQYEKGHHTSWFPQTSPVAPITPGWPGNWSRLLVISFVHAHGSVATAMQAAPPLRRRGHSSSGAKIPSMKPAAERPGHESNGVSTGYPYVPIRTYTEWMEGRKEHILLVTCPTPRLGYSLLVSGPNARAVEDQPTNGQQQLFRVFFQNNHVCDPWMVVAVRKNTLKYHTDYLYQ